MKTRARKAGMVMLCIIIWAMSFAGLGKCDLAQPEYEYGDFTYRILGGESVEKYVTISGLTQEGQEKEVLVVPKTIEGYSVTHIMKGIPSMNNAVDWKSDKLTALYLYDNLFVDAWFHCPNLKGAFMLSVSMEKGFYIGDRLSKIYVSVVHYFACYDNAPYIVYPANITYNYNYESAPNNGCYWLDNLKDGEKITYVPEEPKREGYRFGGWYHEAECINKWDFENDTIISYEYEEYTQETFYENVLYAEWLEI